MQNWMKIGLAAASLASLGFVALGGGGTFTAAAQTDSFSEAQVRSVQKIVKDYLLANPEILFEVRQAYEKKAEAEREEAMQAHLPGFYKALASMKSDLAGFSVGDGDVTLIEFFDYNCGYCKLAMPEVMKLIDSDKKLRVQFIELPILTPGSIEAAKVAVAAAKQRKYLEFHKAMFTAGRASKESALKVAGQIGLNMDKVEADMASPETEALIGKLSELAKGILVEGTPSFIVGDKVNPSAAGYDELKQLVEDARKGGCKTCADATAPSGVKDEKKS